MKRWKSVLFLLWCCSCFGFVLVFNGKGVHYAIPLEYSSGILTSPYKPCL